MMINDNDDDNDDNDDDVDKKIFNVKKRST